MGLFSKKTDDFNHAYARMEGEMISSPKALMKGLGIRDVELRNNRDLSPTQMQQIHEQLIRQKEYNLIRLRDFVASDQQRFFATGEVNVEIRHIFENIDIADSIVITNRIREVKSSDYIEYNERILWDYFNELSRIRKHAFCVSGSLNQIDNLVLLNLKRAGRDGAILKDGSCYFPVQLYESFFDKVRRGNNVIVI